MVKQTIEKGKTCQSKVMTKQIGKTARVAAKPKTSRRQNEEFSIDEKDMVSLPAIDMNDREDKIVPAIMEMLTEVGFLHLKNVPGFREDQLLADVKAFHRLPERIKKAGQPKHLNPANKHVYRGWFPFLDNDVSHKEFFDMGCPYDEVRDEEK